MHISKRRLKFFFSSLSFVFFTASFYTAPPEPKELGILRRAYPDVSFTAAYDAALSDFKIDVVQSRGTVRKTATLYWADGKMLPADKLADRESYWPILYPYAKEVPDPEKFPKRTYAVCAIFLRRKTVRGRRARRSIFSMRSMTAKRGNRRKRT